LRRNPLLRIKAHALRHHSCQAVPVSDTTSS
jgi:hypothetical protein